MLGPNVGMMYKLRALGRSEERRSKELEFPSKDTLDSRSLGDLFRPGLAIVRLPLDPRNVWCACTLFIEKHGRINSTLANIL